MSQSAQLRIHGYLEVRRGPATVPGSVEIVLPPNVRACSLVLSEVQAWHLVARLIVALEGTEHLSAEVSAALASLFKTEDGRREAEGGR